MRYWRRCGRRFISVHVECKSVPPYLPLIIDIEVLAWTFVIVAVLLHALLVWIWPLGKVGWKVVDYVWLAFAVAGVIGAASKARQTQATNQLAIWERHMVDARRQLASDAELFSVSPVLCARFTVGPASPPAEELAEMEQEKQAACNWFKSVSAVVRSSAPLSIGQSAWPIRPPAKTGPTKEVYAIFEQSVREYFKAATDWGAVMIAAKPSEGDTALMFWSPMLLVIGIAIRTTKVTGEVALEISTRRHAAKSAASELPSSDKSSEFASSSGESDCGTSTTSSPPSASSSP